MKTTGERYQVMDTARRPAVPRYADPDYAARERQRAESRAAYMRRWYARMDAALRNSPVARQLPPGVR